MEDIPHASVSKADYEMAAGTANVKSEFAGRENDASSVAKGAVSGMKDVWAQGQVFFFFFTKE